MKNRSINPMTPVQVHALHLVVERLDPTSTCSRTFTLKDLVRLIRELPGFQGFSDFQELYPVLRALDNHDLLRGSGSKTVTTKTYRVTTACQHKWMLLAQSMRLVRLIDEDPNVAAQIRMEAKNLRTFATFDPHGSKIRIEDILWYAQHPQPTI